MEERKELRVVSLAVPSTILPGTAARILDATTTIEEAEVDLVTEEEGALAHMNVIEREITSVIEEETPLEKIDTRETAHLTEDAVALDQTREIKTVAPTRIKEEALINTILPTMVSETKNMIASQENLLLQSFNSSSLRLSTLTIEEILKVEDSAMDNLAVVSPMEGPIITATVAQIPDIPHLDRTTITEATTAKAILNNHAVTLVDNILCVSVLAEICLL